jgi:CYTH domain-containing protein
LAEHPPCKRTVADSVSVSGSIGLVSTNFLPKLSGKANSITMRLQGCGRASKTHSSWFNSSQALVMYQIEIERKWLLYGYPQVTSKLKQDEIISIEQFYTPEGLRYREERRDYLQLWSERYKYWRMKKVKLGECTYEEQDITSLTMDEYHNIKKPDYPTITKRRIVYKHEGSHLKFEVDDFWPLRLITLEVELPSADFQFEMPANIQKQIIMEVTGKVEFSNKYLAERSMKN